MLGVKARPGRGGAAAAAVRTPTDIPGLESSASLFGPMRRG